MKAKPDIMAFLDGGAGDRANRPTAPIKPQPTIQKLFRLRWDVANALKLGATQASIASGKRVTETEIIEDLIWQRFDV